MNKILREITSGLLGDTEKDIAYLREQCEKYKKHEYAQEIIHACGLFLKMQKSLLTVEKKKIS